MASHRQDAYDQIKKMIFRMELLPGDRIPELQIAEKLGISRTPIHDALRTLESEGLVTIGHNRGATVMRFTESEIREIGAVRLAQDILAAQLASRYGSAADFARLDAMADQCETAARNGDVYERIQTDLDYHLEITRIARNSRLLRQQYALYQQIHLIQISQYTDVKDSLTQILHHRPLVNALRAGDLQEIRQLLCSHTRDFYHIDPYVLMCCGGEQ